MNPSELRKLFFVLALLAIASVVLVERGSTGLATKLVSVLNIRPPDARQESLDLFPDPGELDQYWPPLPFPASPPRGLAIPAMQFVDGILLFSILLMGLALLIPPHIHARIQGILTIIFAVSLIIAAIAAIFAALIKLLLMVALLLSFPFGTIAYMIIYSGFPRGSMLGLLGTLFMLRLAFGALLLLAHQDFIKNLGLLVFWVMGFIAGLVVSFLYGIVPGFLVSITDAIAAIVVAIIGVILSIILAVGSIPAVAKAVKVPL